MGRRSKREIERAVDELDTTDAMGRVELWRGYITGEIPPAEYFSRRGEL